MPELCTFDYAVIRVMPLVERGEFINAGVILFCQAHHFLKAEMDLNAPRLAALAPFLDAETVEKYLAAIPAICAGTGAGALGKLPPRARFDWLVAPRSTIIQISAVHSGLCADPEREMERLLNKMVRIIS